MGRLSLNMLAYRQVYLGKEFDCSSILFSLTLIVAFVLIIIYLIIFSYISHSVGIFFSSFSFQ